MRMESSYINDKEMKKEPAKEPGQFSYVRDVDLQSGGTMPFETTSDFEHYIEDLFGVKHDILLRKGAYMGETFGPCLCSRRSACL